MDVLHDSDTEGPQLYKPDDDDPSRKKDDVYAPLFGNQTWHRKVPILRKLWKYSWYWHEDSDSESSRSRSRSRSRERSRPDEKSGQRKKPGHVERDYPLHYYLPWIADWLGSESKHRRRAEMVIEEEIVVCRRGSTRPSRARRVLVEERYSRRASPGRYRSSLRRRPSVRSYVSRSSISSSYMSSIRVDRKKPSVYLLILGACLGVLIGWCTPWKRRSRTVRRVSTRRMSRSGRSIIVEDREPKTTFQIVISTIKLLFKAFWSGLLSCCQPWKKRKRERSPASSYYSYSSGYDSSYDSDSDLAYGRPVRGGIRRRSWPERPVVEEVVVEERRRRSRSSSASRIRSHARRSSDDMAEVIEEHSPRRPSVADSSDRESGREESATRQPRFPKLAHLPSTIKQRWLRRRERRKAREEISEAEEGRARPRYGRRRSSSAVSSRSVSRSRSRSSSRHSRRR